MGVETSMKLSLTCDRCDRESDIDSGESDLENAIDTFTVEEKSDLDGSEWAIMDDTVFCPECQEGEYKNHLIEDLAGFDFERAVQIMPMDWIEQLKDLLEEVK